MKKITAILISVIITIISMTSVFAYPTIDSDTAKLVSIDDNCRYYIYNNKVVMVETEPLRINISDSSLLKDELTKSGTSEIKIYESAPLSNSTIRAIMAGEQTASDQALNNMGNIRATLYLTYSWTTINGTPCIRLVRASSSYEYLIYSEGVVAQNSSLYWNAAGTIYVNGAFSRRGYYGDTYYYSSPSFSNVSLMPSSTYVDPVSAGAEYTLNCSRGVTINVYIELV